MKQSDDLFLGSINVRSSVPVYEQIENHVMFAISSGRIKAGDRLPSVIQLAERLGTNFNTVDKSRPSQALNYPIQGGAAEMTYCAMRGLVPALAGFDAVPVLNIHDELIIDSAVEDAGAVATLLG